MFLLSQLALAANQPTASRQQVVPFFGETLPSWSWKSSDGLRLRPSSMSRDRKLLGRFPTRQRKNTEVVTKQSQAETATSCTQKSLPPRPQADQISNPTHLMPFRDSEPRGRSFAASSISTPKELRLMKKRHKPSSTVKAIKHCQAVKLRLSPFISSSSLKLQQVDPLTGCIIQASFQCGTPWSFLQVARRKWTERLVAKEESRPKDEATTSHNPRRFAMIVASGNQSEIWVVLHLQWKWAAKNSYCWKKSG